MLAPSARPVAGRARWLLLAAGLGLAGCGDGNPPTHDVRGKVVYDDGAPVPGATIVFQPADGRAHPARGRVKEDGTFQLTTFKDGDGAVAGEHKVTLVGLPAADGAKPTRPAVPVQYGDAETSGLTATVTPDAKDVVLTISRVGKPAPRGRPKDGP